MQECMHTQYDIVCKVKEPEQEVDGDDGDDDDDDDDDDPEHPDSNTMSERTEPLDSITPS